MVDLDELERIGSRVLGSAGTGALAVLAFGQSVSWLPILTALVALAVELVKRSKSDGRQTTLADNIEALARQLADLPCRGQEVEPSCKPNAKRPGNRKR